MHFLWDNVRESARGAVGGGICCRATLTVGDDDALALRPPLIKALDGRDVWPQLNSYQGRAVRKVPPNKNIFCLKCFLSPLSRLSHDSMPRRRSGRVDQRGPTGSTRQSTHSRAMEGYGTGQRRIGQESLPSGS